MTGGHETGLMEAAKATTPAERAQRLRWALADRLTTPEARFQFYVMAGVAPRSGHRAFAGRTIAADALLALAAALKLDPVSLAGPLPPQRLAGTVEWSVLGTAVRMTRILLGDSVRDVAARIGVSTATVVRCERGAQLSFDALARLAAYAGQHPHGFTHAPPAKQAAPVSTGNTHCNTLKCQE